MDGIIEVPGVCGIAPLAVIICGGDRCHRRPAARPMDWPPASPFGSSPLGMSSRYVAVASCLSRSPGSRSIAQSLYNNIAPIPILTIER